MLYLSHMLPDKDVAIRSSKPVLLWLFPAASLFLALLLGPGSAILVPDAMVYRRLATGPRASVPAPFSARILGPAAAKWLGQVTGSGVDKGFMILGILSLVAILASMTYLLRSQAVDAGIFAGVFLMPFWLKLFNSFYLPDLLHAAILGALLVCLVSGRMTLAMLLLFPAYLTRESTLLVAICLVWAAWRRISVRAILTGCLATLAGMLVSRHFVQLGAANVRGVGGAQYILGKLVWSFFRNIFGLPLWTNAFTLPPCNPVWTTALPSWLHFGAVHVIGVCHPSLWGPARVLLAWFGVFGIGPAFAAAYIGATLSRPAMRGDFWLKSASASGESSSRSVGAIIAFRFCVLYGAITFILAPLLGASVDRLAEYAWPFYFVALTWVVSASIAAHVRFPRGRGLGLLFAHLAASWIAWVGFSREEPTRFYFHTGLVALMLNITAYIVLRRFIRGQAAGLSPLAGVKSQKPEQKPGNVSKKQVTFQLRSGFYLPPMENLLARRARCPVRGPLFYVAEEEPL